MAQACQSSKQASNNLAILIGRADGSFEPQVTYPTGTSPKTIATLDTNTDDITDLAVLNSNTLSIFIGQANGIFQPQVTYATEESPHDLITLDVNRDGLTDLALLHGDNQSVFAYGSSSKLGVFINLPNGTFAPEVLYEAGINANSLTKLDSNHDNITDLAMTDGFGNNFSVFRGRADGTFETPTIYPTGPLPSSLLVVDANRDNRKDIFVTGYRPSLHLGTISGDFLPGTFYNEPVSPFTIFFFFIFPGPPVLVEDINKSYIPDLFTTSFNGLKIIE